MTACTKRRCVSYVQLRDVWCTMKLNIGIMILFSLTSSVCGGTVYMEMPLMNDLTNKTISVEIKGGSSNNYGRLHLKINDTSAVVCARGVHHYTVYAACKSVGYQTGYLLNTWDDIRTERTPDGTAVWLSNLRCRGREVRLSDCPQATTSGLASCEHGNELRIFCIKSGTVRMEGSWWGNLKYRLGTGDRPICGNNFDDADATVICKDHGRDLGKAFPNNEMRPQGGMLRGNVTCPADVTSFAGCTMDEYTHDSQCPGKKTAAVICYDANKALTNSMTLSRQYFGRVHFKRFNVTGTFCDSNFTVADATVICRTAGHNRGLPLVGNPFNTINYPYPFWYRDFRCSGNETSIFNCPVEEKDGNSTHLSYCSRSKRSELGVICYNDSTPESHTSTPRVRLSHGDGRTHGLMMVRYRGVWGYVADKDITWKDAVVFCRELNTKYQDAIVRPYRSYNRDGNQPLLLFDLACNGSEASVFDCPHAPWGDHKKAVSYNYKYEVGIVCRDTSIPITRNFLVNNGRTYGRVQVNMLGIIATLCDPTWDDVDSHVLCRQLGFKYSWSTTGHVITGPFWQTNVHCIGNETNMKDCSSGSRHAMVSSCSVGIDVACQNTQRFRYRLLDGGKNYGRAELAIGNEWRSICYVNFNQICATSICRQLGYQWGKELTPRRFGKGKESFWFRTTEHCTNNSTSYHEKKTYEFGRYPNCQRHHEVAVYCYNNPLKASNGHRDINGAYGHLQSANWPESYPDNCRNTWSITAPAKHRIVLRFITLQIQNTGGCTADSVSVYDGNSIESRLLGKYCGTTLPAVIPSSGNFLFVMFSSDAGGVSKGFSASYDTECMGKKSWSFVGSNHTIAGDNFEVTQSLSLILCMKRCDSNSACLQLSYNREGRICYLELSSFYGSEAVRATGLEKYERRCNQGHYGVPFLVKVTGSELEALRAGNNEFTSGTLNWVKFEAITSKSACQAKCLQHRLLCSYIALHPASSSCFVKSLQYAGIDRANLPSSGLDIYHSVWQACSLTREHSSKVTGSHTKIYETKAINVWECETICEMFVQCTSTTYSVQTKTCIFFSTRRIVNPQKVDMNTGTIHTDIFCSRRTQSHSRCEGGSRIVTSEQYSVSLPQLGLVSTCIGACLRRPSCMIVSYHTGNTDNCVMHSFFKSRSNEAIGISKVKNSGWSYCKILD